MLGDTILTANVFPALLPKLRDLRFRTFAEAQQARLALTGVSHLDTLMRDPLF